MTDAAAERHDAEAVARGTARLLARMGFETVRELTLRSGRRADLAAVDGGGRIILVEIKVSLADFRGDRKWPEYLGHCDAFYFAVPPGLDHAAFAEDAALPELTGLIVADRFDAQVLRDPAWVRLAPRLRKDVTLRMALTAAARLGRLIDPGRQLS